MMPTVSFYLLMLSLLLTVSSGKMLAKPAVEIKLPIKNLVEGERGKVHFISYNEHLENLNKTIDLGEITLNYNSSYVLPTATRDTCFLYSYEIEPLPVGEYEIPSISFELKNQNVTIPATAFTVHPLPAFDKKTITLNGEQINYYSATFLSTPQAYLNEAVTAEVRYLIPKKAKVKEWGVTEIEENPGILAWRLEPPHHYHSSNSKEFNTSTFFHQNTSFIGGTYHTTLHGTIIGKTAFGKINARLILPFNKDGFGGFRMGQYKRANFLASPSSLTILPLPQPQPESFKGGVGQFTLAAQPVKISSLTVEESLKISLSLKGKGNFQSVTPPELRNPENWEIIDVTSKYNTNQRKKLNNNITFNYLLSPKKAGDSTPIFDYTYFDPKTASYQKISTKKQALKIQAVQQTAAAAPLLFLDLEKQQSILGYLSPVKDEQKTSFSLPFDWQYIPFSLALAMIIFWFIKHCIAFKQRHRSYFERKKQFKKLKNPHLKPAGFYREVGHYIEQWLDKKHQANDPKIQRLLKMRDRLCYEEGSAFSQQKKKSISKTEKKEIRRYLRTLSLIGISCILFFNFNSRLQAEENAFQIDLEQAIKKNKHQEVRNYYLHHTPKTATHWYNYGNSLYHNQEYGNAALCYYRALLLNPEHPETRQNLRFVSPKNPIDLAEQTQNEEKNKTFLEWTQQIIFYSKKSSYQTLQQLLLWLLALLLLLRTLFHPQLTRKTKLLINSLLIFKLHLALATWLIIHYYPQNFSLNPLKELAVITSSDYALQTEPKTAKNKKNNPLQIVKLTETSLCRPLRTRASWTYIELSSGTRGWVKTAALTHIQPPNN